MAQTRINNLAYQASLFPIIWVAAPSGGKIKGALRSILL